MIPTVVLCGLSEIIGWSERLWSSYNARDIDPFTTQITTITIAPSFLTAAVFNVLRLIIWRVGTQYSLLPPRWYLRIFMSFDLAALIIQAIGGRNAPIAMKQGNDAEPGGKIMMYGAIVQMIGMTLFCILGADFLSRFYWNKPLRPAVFSSRIDGGAKFRAFPAKVRLMLLGVGIATVWVLIRSIFRTIELADGRRGKVISNQVYFTVFDGVPLVLAMVTLNLFHPRWLLRE